MNKHSILFIVTLLLLSLGLILNNCGSSSSSDENKTSPSVPTGLTATGSLGNISLNWTASSGGNFTGYNIYRSLDGTTFTKVNTSLVSGTSYDDTIVSPDGDGILYHYRVTALGDNESGASNTVKNIHGTRLAASLASGLTTETTLSPYVVDGTVISEGSVTIAKDTKFYMIDNSVLDIFNGEMFSVNGLFRVLASTTAPASLTSHDTGTGISLNWGFTFEFIDCVDYDSGDNSGTLLQNMHIRNLRARHSLLIRGCTPKFNNLYISANNLDTAAYIQIESGAIIQHCSITGTCPQIIGDQKTTGLQIDHNIINPGEYNYISDIAFSEGTIPLNDGQITNNSFDNTIADTLNIGAVLNAGTIPLGNNYWKNGQPSIRYQNPDTSPPNAAPDFTPTLSSPPAGVGPTW